jgi:Polyketide cyclase / dehydrase and lipid transport
VGHETFRVERDIIIFATAQRVFALIDDFHAWSKWSPYEKLDPAMQKTYSGAPRGVGASYTWSGKKTGTGAMEITQTEPPLKVVIALTFTKPMKAKNVAEFLLEPSGNATRVTWRMSGDVTWMTRIFRLFVNLDKMIGKDFEAGLSALKTLVEKG